MTTDESNQCIQDVVSWFKRSSELSFEPLDSEEVEPIPKASGSSLDTVLSSLLTETGGAIWYGDKEGFTPSKVIEACSAEDFQGGTPFAADVDDEFYLVITEDGEVKEWTQDDGYGDETLGGCFADYLEEYRNDLLAGKYEYVEDCGCMEKAGAGGGGRK
jgi:hypothetical protein